MRKSAILFYLFLFAGFKGAFAQLPSYQQAGNGNPIIPGYFADPTVKKFGDTYYIYATTDGNGGGLGPSQVWTSKDFVNWTYQDMNWPTTHVYWAPDVAHGNDGKYYLYYCQPVDIYGASSDSPTGPWKPLLPGGKAIVPNYFVPKVITLDGQTFRDDDGKFYMTWGTWGIYPGYGCGIGLLNPDMRSFAQTAQIPNTDATDFFEGSFMFKRKGIYYLMYSSGYCENETYRVQYAMSRKGPMEGFVFGKNNPILSTNEDGTVHGPGHNSMLQIGDDYYIIYHRHNNPHSNGGYHRQVCADKMEFDVDGNIKKITPTHIGIGLLGKNAIPHQNLALNKTVNASSYYSLDYRPSFAADDNNGTLWKPAHNDTGEEWLQIDLGKPTHIQTILTQFEYATWYYQYKIEYSNDGRNWKMFADKQNNHWHGSPYVDNGDATARYVRLTITNTQYPGLYKAVWNIKIYGERLSLPVPANIRQSGIAENYKQQGLLIDLNTDSLQTGVPMADWKNSGKLNGSFHAEGQTLFTDIIGGRKAVMFNGKQSLLSSFRVPQSLAGNNSYSVAYWVYANSKKDSNPLLSWAHDSEQLTGATFGFGSNRDAGAIQHFGFADMPFDKRTALLNAWHFIVVTFDGCFEKLYVDGVLSNTENKMLFIHPSLNFMLGSNGDADYFNGALSSIKVYDHPLTDSAILIAYEHVKLPGIKVHLDAAKLPYGNLNQWHNEGDVNGDFETQNAPVVKDVDGKIAVSFSAGEKMELNKPVSITNSYSVAYSLYAYDKLHSLPTGLVKNGHSFTRLNDGKWHFIVENANNNNIALYIDGVLAGNYTSNQQVLNNRHWAINAESKFAISCLDVIDHQLSLNKIKTDADLWRKNLHSPVNGSLSFSEQPEAISPKTISMQAESAAKGNNLQYDFIRTAQDGTKKESGWQNDPGYLDNGLLPNNTFAYSFKVKDFFGNVTAESPTEKTSTNTVQFTIFKDDFTTDRNLLAAATGTIWDGIMGKGQDQTADKITSANGLLTLSSTNSNWDGNKPYGPFVFKNIKGDFVAEVEVADVSGLTNKKVNGNNDAGLMVRLAIADTTTDEHLIQNSIFPAWNVGNMLTSMNNNRNQTNTQAGWNFNKYLQIQRKGDWFYARTSTDGINWAELPGSPLYRPDMNGKTLQVGPYQSTYGNLSGYGSFSHFRIIMKK